MQRNCLNLFCLFCCFLRIHFYGIHHHFSCHHSGESYELFSPSTKEANPRLGTTVSAWSHATETSTFSWYLCQSLPFLWIVKSHVGIGNIRMLIWVLCFFMWSCFLGIEYCVHVHEYTALYNIVFVLLECMQLCYYVNIQYTVQLRFTVKKRCFPGMSNLTWLGLFTYSPLSSVTGQSNRWGDPQELFFFEGWIDDHACRVYRYIHIPHPWIALFFQFYIGACISIYMFCIWFSEVTCIFIIDVSCFHILVVCYVSVYHMYYMYIHVS